MSFFENFMSPPPGEAPIDGITIRYLPTVIIFKISQFTMIVNDINNDGLIDDTVWSRVNSVWAQKSSKDTGNERFRS